MNRKLKRKLRLIRLCGKYGYNQTASLLRTRIERARDAQMADDSPILHNLTQREDASK